MVGTFLFAASLVACGMPGHGRVVSKAVLVAVGVTTEGRRELLGYDVVASETEDSWLGFLRGLQQHDLGGLRCAIV